MTGSASRPRSVLSARSVLDRGDPAVPRERALVAASELARVQTDRPHLALADVSFDAPTRQCRVERVIVCVKAQIGIDGDAHHPAAVQIGNAGSGAFVPCSSASRSIGRQRSVRCVLVLDMACRRSASSRLSLRANPKFGANRDQVRLNEELDDGALPRSVYAGAVQSASACTRCY